MLRRLFLLFCSGARLFLNRFIYRVGLLFFSIFLYPSFYPAPPLYLPICIPPCISIDATHMFVVFYVGTSNQWAHKHARGLQEYRPSPTVCLNLFFSWCASTNYCSTMKPRTYQPQGILTVIPTWCVRSLFFLSYTQSVTSLHRYSITNQ